MKPDFGNQYLDFEEEEDPKLPTAKIKELPRSIFVNSNHGHDKITGNPLQGSYSVCGENSNILGIKKIVLYPKIHN